MNTIEKAILPLLFGSIFAVKNFPKNTIGTFLPLLIGSIVAIRNVQKTVLGHFYPFLLGQSASRSEKLSEVGSDLFLT